MIYKFQSEVELTGCRFDQIQNLRGCGDVAAAWDGEVDLEVVADVEELAGSDEHSAFADFNGPFQAELAAAKQADFGVDPFAFEFAFWLETFLASHT